MKKLNVILILLAIFMSSCATQNSDSLGLIPRPRKIDIRGGELNFPDNSKIFLDEKLKGSQSILEYLNSKLKSGLGMELSQTEDPDEALVILLLDEKIKGNESYRLDVDENIEISASSSNGIFYGIQTVLQLLPPNVFGAEPKRQVVSLPRVEIEDFPEFEWRGMHLDVGRHYFPVEDIKKYIDYLAIHKMNMFHWHLTEDQGWRIEIKKYPKLTTVGAFRKETMGDGIPYGGFYTQDEIREVVTYASDRFIQIVPEIEMPGHSVAALAAYPELACTDGPFEVWTEWGVNPDVYCAGKEVVFTFLEDVLTEVMGLFPGEYIHIGGDECPKVRWEKCPDCQARIKAEGLHNEHELQSYFIKRIEKFLNDNGRRLIGWDEILEGGLAPQASVMSWRGMQGGLEAVASDHSVVMTPTSNCYFDYYQGNPEFEPPAIGGYLPLSKVYAFDPVPDTLDPTKRNYILGAQGNVWTEYMNNFQHVEYMAFPRIAAMSELLWLDESQKNFTSFLTRLQKQFERYDALGINYSTSVFRVSTVEKYDSVNNVLSVELTSEIENPKIRFSLDGTVPTLTSKLYSSPIELKSTAKLSARLEFNGSLQNPITSKNYNLNSAFGKEVVYKTDYNKNYPAGGDFALVDGVRGSLHYRDGRWQGFLGNDMEAVIDLGELKKVSSIKVGFLQRMISSIFFPVDVEFFVSKDGKEFVRIGKSENTVPPKIGQMITKEFSVKQLETDTRYIKVRAKNLGVCPDWHRNAGGKAWLFVDEIVVE